MGEIWSLWNSPCSVRKLWLSSGRRVAWSHPSKACRFFCSSFHIKVHGNILFSFMAQVMVFQFLCFILGMKWWTDPESQSEIHWKPPHFLVFLLNSGKSTKCSRFLWKKKNLSADLRKDLYQSFSWFQWGIPDVCHSKQRIFVLTGPRNFAVNLTWVSRWS